jgi:porphobilinogen synthase
MFSGIAACQEFPRTRLRRTRRFHWLQSLVKETSLDVHNLIWPVFVHDRSEGAEPIVSMPGVFRYGVTQLVEEVEEARKLGIPAVALFPDIARSKRDAAGSEALNPEGLVCTAIRAIKEAVPDIGIVCDVALDPFTDHGHDGVFESGEVSNDRTIEILCRQAVLQAEAGCDIVAPSDMMDGRIAAIRAALDEAKFAQTVILSYGAKYDSALYGPFREAVGAQRLLGADAIRGYRDKSSYQMDVANSDEAIREIALDIAEGADIVMVKPALSSLDIIYRVKETFGVPTFAYQVSGEYASLVSAAERGALDKARVAAELALCMRRAGADAIVTYFARDLARHLRTKGTMSNL